MKINFESTVLLRLFLGLVFLSAGLYRVFNWQIAQTEMSGLNINIPYLSVLIVVLEIIGGLFLILNYKTRITLSIFTLFLSLTLIYSLLVYGKNIIGGASELFIFSPNPTDFFLHLTYLFILISLVIPKKTN